MNGFEEAKKRANSLEFEARIASHADIAAQYGQRFLGTTKEVTLFYRRSSSPPVSPAKRRAMLNFVYLSKGPDAEHTLVGTKDPEAARELLCEKYTITYMRVEIDSGNIVIVDKGNRWRLLIKAVADELGVKHETRFGEAKFL